MHRAKKPSQLAKNLQDQIETKDKQAVLENILHSYKVHNLVLFKHGDLVAANDKERLCAQGAEAKVLDEQYDLLRQAEQLDISTDAELTLLLKLWVLENVSAKMDFNLTISDKMIVNILTCLSERLVRTKVPE